MAEGIQRTGDGKKRNRFDKVIVNNAITWLKCKQKVQSRWKIECMDIFERNKVVVNSIIILAKW